MKANLFTANSSYYSRASFLHLRQRYSNPFPNRPPSFLFLNPRCKPSSFVPICYASPVKPSNSSELLNSSELQESSIPFSGEEVQSDWNVQVGSHSVPSYVQSSKLSMTDQAFLLLAFIACTTSVAFTSFVVAAVPTLFAMGRAATSLAKLADTACEELPSTMAAIRLSGMELSDLTLELSDLSQEIADGVNKSAQAVQAAEAGIRKIGTLAHQQTIAMIQERASLPIISLQPVVAGAAKKTTRAVGKATKTFMNMISGGESSSENEEDSGIDRVV